MKIINAIKSRLPGGSLHTEYSKFSRLKYHQISQSNPLESAFIPIKKYIQKQYYFGQAKAIKQLGNRDDLYLYNIFCELFTDETDSNYFNFNGIKLPKPYTDAEIPIFVYEVRDILLYHLINNTALCDTVAFEGPYEYNNVKILPGDIVIDCGANIGMFAALASHKGATVFAFEPFGIIIDNYLSKTIACNQSISICKLAVSDKQQELEFEIYEAMDAGRLSSVGEVSSNAKQAVKIEQVQAVTIDNFISENKISKVDFIKADIEGAERNMLKGATHVLKEFSPKLAICTYHLPDDPKIIREIILDANPNYIIEERWKKLYAHIPKG